MSTFAKKFISLKYYNNILETIGNTPLVKLNKITEDIKATVLAKVETFNPGNSVKDRMALQMIEDAENDGRLKSGGTVIECTSGNTGMGLALACIIKGYKLVCTLADKQSQEKIDILRAMGVECIVCPTSVAPEDPRSYYSVANRVAKDTPNSFFVNQYDNPSNAKAHYLSTGPEIWEQTEGKITHFVVGVGTGGTISGVGKYLKEKNPNVKIWGIDTYGSVFKKYHETGEIDPNEIYSYVTEGIGEDILPLNVDFDIIDKFEKVTDKDGAVYTRKLALEEALFVGNSAGSAIKGLLQLKDELTENDVVVVLFHDHGSRYVGKMFNDDWMMERGYIDKRPTAMDLIKGHKNLPLVTCTENDSIQAALDKFKKFNISQIPVVNEKNEFVGALNDHDIYGEIVSGKISKSDLIKNKMQAPFPVIEGNATIDEIAPLISKENQAVIVRDSLRQPHIISKYDLIMSIK